MASPSKPQKTEFLNRTQGWIGAVKINRKGDEVQEPVAPGERVFLTAEERTLTEQAYKRGCSPFEPTQITWRAMATGEIICTFTAAKLTAKPDLPDPLPELEAMATYREKQAREAEQQAQSHPALAP